MNKLRLRYSTLLVLCFLLLVSGCGDSTEVNNLAIVAGVGVDKVPGKEPILLTVQIVNPSGMKTGKQGGGEKAYVMETSRGKTFFDAVSNLSKVMPRKVYFDHNKVVILGKKFAESGITEAFDYMERNREFRETNVILVAEDMAKDALVVNINTEKIPANGISEIAKNNVFVYQSNRNDFLLGLRSIGVTVAPTIQVETQENETTQKVKIEKTAILKNYRLKGFVSADDSKDILWLTNKVKEDNVIVPYKLNSRKQEITVDILNGKTKLTPKYTEKGITIDIECTGKGRLRDAGDTFVNIINSELVKQINKETEQTLKKRMEKTIETAQKRYNSDFIGFSETIHTNNPVQWKSLKKEWDQKFPQIKYNVHFKIDIVNVGSSSHSINEIIRED